jgi:hypothetical protein
LLDAHALSNVFGTRAMKALFRKNSRRGFDRFKALMLVPGVVRRLGHGIFLPNGEGRIL